MARGPRRWPRSVAQPKTVPLACEHRGPLVELCKKRPHRLSKFGQNTIHVVAVEQLSAKVLFQSFDGIAERWLRDAAVLGCASKVLLFAKLQKVSYLIQFHRRAYSSETAGV